MHFFIKIHFLYSHEDKLETFFNIKVKIVYHSQMYTKRKKRKTTVGRQRKGYGKKTVHAETNNMSINSIN